MAKKIKYGTVEVNDESFDDQYASIRVSMMLPLNMIKDLKTLSLNEKHQGKYQVLIRDVLDSWISQQNPRSKKAKELKK